MVPQSSVMKKVIVLTGPTAIGKTEYSLAIAKELDTEIINCDASQFRKGLDIGTAKIDLTKTNVVHHLIDIIPIEDDFSIKDFQKIAREKINVLHEHGKIPLLVGGSGLYINAVLGDYQLDYAGRDPIFEAQFQNINDFELHAYLETLDSLTAEKIHPHNRRRVLRAIEASLQGTNISQNQKGRSLLYDALIICLDAPRDLLYQRINERVEQMLACGWIEEVQGLKQKGIKLETIKDIGYKELHAYLDGVLDLESAKALIKQKTRNYAKRQITWFKHKMECTFIDVDYQNTEKTKAEIMEVIGKFVTFKA